MNGLQSSNTEFDDQPTHPFGRLISRVHRHLCGWILIPKKTCAACKVDGCCMFVVEKVQAILQLRGNGLCMSLHISPRISWSQSTNDRKSRTRSHVSRLLGSLLGHFRVRIPFHFFRAPFDPFIVFTHLDGLAASSGRRQSGGVVEAGKRLR